MSRTYEDDVAPAQYLQETGASDVKFARMMLPHTASLWQSLDDNTVCCKQTCVCVRLCVCVCVCVCVCGGQQNVEKFNSCLCLAHTHSDANRGHLHVGSPAILP